MVAGLCCGELNAVDFMMWERPILRAVAIRTTLRPWNLAAFRATSSTGIAP
jgi:hypothetical protein